MNKYRMFIMNTTTKIMPIVTFKQIAFANRHTGLCNVLLKKTYSDNKTTIPRKRRGSKRKVATHSLSKEPVEMQRKFDGYAKYGVAALTMTELKEFGKSGTEQSSFEFLRKELPTRLANIMKEISLLPKDLLCMPSVAMVESWYIQSFREFLEFEDANGEDPNILKEFSDSLVKIRNRHATVVETMAQGVMELKKKIDTQKGGTDPRSLQIEYFLDRFYTNRISIRMLINQHALLYGAQQGDPTHIGGIDPYCNVLEVIKDAYSDARFMCEQHYLTAPEVHYECYNPFENSEMITIEYLPSHLHHMLFELFKNSMRAVVDAAAAKGISDVPPLVVTVCKGRDDLTIKLSDQGGGIPHDMVDLLFQYMYTTAPDPSPANTSQAGFTPMAGYGYGLPLSRLYARYLNGNLVLNPMEGYGTDAVLYLKVSGAQECLPVYNTTASKMYTNDIQVSDWSSPNPQFTSSRNFSTSSWRGRKSIAS